MTARESLSVLNRSFEKPSVGRVITFPKRCSKRLSVAAVARKAKVKVLCVIQRKVFISCVIQERCFLSLHSYYLIVNLLLVSDLVNLVLERLTTGCRVF